MSKVKRRVLTILLIPISFVVAVLLFEVMLWIFNYKPVLRQAWYLTDAFRVMDDHIIMIRPALLQEDAFSKKKDSIQIVALGDSFTEGFPVDETESYPAVLEAFFQEETINVDVINAGIGNTGADQHLKLLKEYILPQTDPDIVIWQLYANDAWDNVLYPVYSLSSENRLVPESGKSHWLYVRQNIYQSIPFPDGIKKKSRLVNLILKSTESLSQSQIPREFRENPVVWGYTKLDREIEEILWLSEFHKFDLYFFLIAPQAVYFAESDDYSPRWEESWSVREYQNIHTLLSRNTNFVETKFTMEDVQLLKQEFDDKQSLSSIATGLFSGEENDPNPAGDRHLNRYGYWLLARKIGARIISDKFDNNG